MLGSNDCLDMTIAVDWGVKPQTKQNKIEFFFQMLTGTSFTYFSEITKDMPVFSDPNYIPDIHKELQDASLWKISGLKAVAQFAWGVMLRQLSQFPSAAGKTSPGPEVRKLFSYSTQLSTKFQLLIKTKKMTKKFLALSLSDVVFIMLINVKMPTIVGILTFMSRINFVLS